MEKESNTPNEMKRSINQQPHLSDYFEILKRRKWIILFSFFMIVGATAAISFWSTPQYKASVRVLLKGQPTPMNPMGEDSEIVQKKLLTYKNQINLLSNRALARQVIDNLSLRDAFASNQASDSIFSLSALKISSWFKKEDMGDDDISLDNREKILQAKLLNWYLGHLSIDPVQDSSLVDISFTGPDPELITRIVNEHAQLAIDNAVESHQSQAKRALEWLKSQIEEQKDAVQQAQRAIYEFKKKHDVLSLEDNQIVNSIDLQELNNKLAQAKAERIQKQVAYLQLKSAQKTGKDIMELPQIADDSVIVNLRLQLINLKSKKFEMSTKYGPKHPKMIEIENGIQQVANEIHKESERIKNTIKIDLERAVAIEKSLNGSLNEQKQYAISMGEIAIEYDVLKQQAKSTQDVYDFLLKQSETLGLTSAISSSSLRIIDKAEVPVKPFSPKIFLNLVVAIFFSLFTGACIAFFIEYLDNTAKTPMDVSVKLGLPVLGLIPFQKSLVPKNGDTPLIEDTHSPTARDFDAAPIYHISNRLPRALRSPAEGLFGRVLLVESVTMNEGKTTVIARIASNLIDAGLRVLLIDCDFQRPSLDKLFNVSNGDGLGSSIDRIMSHQLYKGTLNQYSIDDIFFLIALKKRSGRLLIENEEQRFTVYFQHGVLVHILNNSNPESHRIGNMLLNGGFISKIQLDYALEIHQRTGQPLGYILVNAGYVSREKLRGPLRLQNEEYLQKIFSWKNGKFVFKSGMINIYENEKIFFEEDYSSLIANLSRIEHSKFLEKELFSQIRKLSKENMYLLPAGKSYKLIGSFNQVLMRKIFDKLRQHFDVLLIDTPPLDAASGIESIFQLADGILMVIKAGHLSVKVINGAVNHLPEDKIIGAVLNQAKVNPNPYYY